jgi:hypothetical protein
LPETVLLREINSNGPIPKVPSPRKDPIYGTAGPNVANASGKVSIHDPWRYNLDMTTETSSQSLQMPPSPTRALGIFERRSPDDRSI